MQIALLLLLKRLRITICLRVAIFIPNAPFHAFSWAAPHKMTQCTHYLQHYSVIARGWTLPSIVLPSKPVPRVPRAPRSDGCRAPAVSLLPLLHGSLAAARAPEAHQLLPRA